ncbi:MAG: hypothetical protein BA863_02165 [Desulfovibrio sp. S3730MH75]|nr:MAG: hypothetical protein BA863_02165 [Desulfovibrio sp. S3730MH75]
MEEKIIEKGCLIALTLPEGTVPERLYVGLVKAVDSRGVRLGLVDRLAVDLGYDLFVSWEHLKVFLLVTPQENLEPFWKCVSRWAEKIT